MLPLLLTACKRVPAVASSSQSTSVQLHRQQVAAARQDLDLIPPPSKNRYLAVRTLSGWENPFLTVQDNVMTLHVMLHDPIPPEMGAGGVLRPTSARRQDLSIRISDLPTALPAIPADSWPYGRVIAIEEAHNIEATSRPAVRRNMEAAIQVLNDLGIVVDEWSEPGTNTMH